MKSLLYPLTFKKFEHKIKSSLNRGSSWKNSSEILRKWSASSTCLVRMVEALSPFWGLVSNALLAALAREKTSSSTVCYSRIDGNSKSSIFWREIIGSFSQSSWEVPQCDLCPLFTRENQVKRKKPRHEFGITKAKMFIWRDNFSPFWAYAINIRVYSSALLRFKVLSYAMHTLVVPRTEPDNYQINEIYQVCS